MQLVEAYTRFLLTDIMPVLIVQETPVGSKESIQDTHATIEGQLGNLGCLQLAISVAIFDY
jgi:hypothetical protein